MSIVFSALRPCTFAAAMSLIPGCWCWMKLYAPRNYKKAVPSDRFLAFVLIGLGILCGLGVAWIRFKFSPPVFPWGEMIFSINNMFTGGCLLYLQINRSGNRGRKGSGGTAGAAYPDGGAQGVSRRLPCSPDSNSKTSGGAPCEAIIPEGSLRRVPGAVLRRFRA